MSKIDAGERLRYARSVDRRQFPRVNAPVFCRPIGRPLFRRRTADVSLGGMRLFADLYLPGEIEITCRVEVVWIEELPEGAPARFDVGVKFVDIGPQDRERLALVLKPD